MRRAAVAAVARRLGGQTGPALLLVKVEKGNEPGIGRVEIPPPEISRRFQAAARG